MRLCTFCNQNQNEKIKKVIGNFLNCWLKFLVLVKKFSWNWLRFHLFNGLEREGIDSPVLLIENFDVQSTLPLVVFRDDGIQVNLKKDSCYKFEHL